MSSTTDEQSIDAAIATGALWRQHRLEQIARLAQTTTATQRLAWLQQALRFALQTGALPRLRADRAEQIAKLWNPLGTSSLLLSGRTRA